MRKIHGFVCILLFNIVFLTSTVYASKHTHELVFDHYVINYHCTSNTAENHFYRRDTVYKCKSCSAFIYEEGEERSEGHDISVKKYTGANYHAGDVHRAEYTGTCATCKMNVTLWDTYACPGNGKCISPLKIMVEQH